MYLHAYINTHIYTHVHLEAASFSQRNFDEMPFRPSVQYLSRLLEPPPFLRGINVMVFIEDTPRTRR